MRRLLLPLLAVALLAPLPLRAQYYTPEQVLVSDSQFDSGKTRNKRGAQAAAEEQEANRNNTERLTVRDWWETPGQQPKDPASGDVSAVADASDDTNLHAAPPADEDAFEKETQTDGAGNTPDPSDPRVIDTIMNSLHSLDTNDDAGRAYDNNETFHSRALHAGAPLAETGPTADIAVGVMIVSTGWTMWRARRMKAMR